MKFVATCTTLAALLGWAGSTQLSAQAPAPESPAPAKQDPGPNPRALPRQPPGELPAPPSDPGSSQRSTEEFRFNGGLFDEFVGKLRATYGSNALELLEIPAEARSIRVPKMRFPTKNMNIRSVFYIYNSTSEAGDWYLGKWIYFPQQNIPDDDNRLRTLVFFPPKLANPASTSGIGVRAFDVARIKPEDRERLRSIVLLECDRLQLEMEAGRFARQDPADISGRISLHESSGLLVATGGKAYVELVASLVAAFEKQRTTPGPSYKP